MAMTHQSFVTVVQRECFLPISLPFGACIQNKKWREDKKEKRGERLSIREALKEGLGQGHR